MEFLDPEKILQGLELKNNMVVADFGSGSGDWTIPLARILSKGKVIAVDILEEPLSVLRRNKRDEKLFNIDILRANLEKKTTILSESCDWVFMVDLLFQCENKKAVLEEGKRVLKKGGKILVIDWLKDNPLTEEKEFCSIETIKEFAKELNLSVEKEFKASDFHWGLILVK